MAVYRMTPARRAALEKAQEASARKRRKLHNRSRIRRNIKIGASAVAVAGVYGGGFYLHSGYVNERIISHHIDVARYQHRNLNALRARVFPTSALTNPAFDEVGARREALKILSRGKKRKIPVLKPL